MYIQSLLSFAITTMDQLWASTLDSPQTLKHYSKSLPIFVIMPTKTKIMH